MKPLKPVVRGKLPDSSLCPCSHTHHAYLHGEGNIGRCLIKGCGCAAFGNVAPPRNVCACGLEYGKKATLALHQRLTGHGDTLPPEALALL